MKKEDKKGIECEVCVNMRDKRGEYISAEEYFKNTADLSEWWRAHEEEGLVEFYGAMVQTRIKKGVSDEF